MRTADRWKRTIEQPRRIQRRRRKKNKITALAGRNCDWRFHCRRRRCRPLGVGGGRGWWDSFEKVAIHRRPIGASTPAISSLGRRFLFYFLRRLLLGPYGRWMALSLKKKHRHWLISLSCLPSFLPGFLKFFSFRFGFQQDKLSQVNWLWIYFFKRVFLTFFLRSNLFIMKFYLVLLGFFCYFHIFLFKLAFN